MTAAIVLAAVIAYIAILFVVAQRGEQAPVDESARRRQLLYALSLTVYVTSWTYFAAIGEAAENGWGMIGFYLGPIIAVTLFGRVWARIASATKREKAGSIADFLASRYGRSHALGALVTAVALIAALPHIALQLNALTIGWHLIATGTPSPSSGTVVVVAVLLLVFAILFGARNADLTAQNRGLLHAIGVQAIVKIVALACVALFAFSMIRSAPLPPLAQAQAARLSALPDINGNFLSMTLLGFTAMFCFPKQFHVGFVQLKDVGDIRAARWIVPAYFAVAGLAIAPLVIAGTAFAPHIPALYALSLPLSQGKQVLLALVSIGGFSAAATMVVVETIALSAMVSNELLLPWITWRTQRDHPRDANFVSIIIWVRRVTMLIVLGAACLFVFLNPPDALRTIGIASFVASAQLFPLLIGAVYWQRASIWGALAGLSGGMLAWAWAGFKLGVTGTLNPGYTSLDSLTFTVISSLSVNITLFVVVSLLMPVRMIDRVTARSFVHGLAPRPRAEGTPELRARVDDLTRLVAHFLGEDGARDGLAQFGRDTGQSLRPDDRVTPQLAQAAERMLAGFIGSSSARSVIAVALAGPYGARSDILGFLDNAMGAVEFNRSVLQSALDSLPQGMCVLDENRRLIAWNDKYLALFAPPDGLTALQRPWPAIADAIAARCRENGENVEAFGADLEEPAQIDLLLADDRAISGTRALMTGGGVVLSFTDVSEDRAREAALRRAAGELERANETLEARVIERTQALETAKEQAERADRAKTRFVAAASHDLQQPLHAARLFIAALKEDLRDAPERAVVADNADRAIGSADRMLRALLNLSQLDAGGIKPLMRAVFINDLLLELSREFAQMAERKGLRLRIAPSSVWIVSDPDLLRSMLQNLIINAIRYTDRGGVLIGCRRQGPAVRIEIWDSGRGIASDSLKLIFGEFVRLERRSDEPGMGLGLAIVDRVANALGHGLLVQSRAGRGSVFSVTVEIAEAPRTRARAKPAKQPSPSLSGLRVLCVDDDQAVLQSVGALLTRWGASVTLASGADEDLTHNDEVWEAALLDYQISDDLNGIDLLRRLEARIGRAAIVTANSGETLRPEAEALGAVLLQKPLDAEVLRRFLIDVYHDQLVVDPD